MVLENGAAQGGVVHGGAVRGDAVGGALLAAAAELEARRTPYCLATVVWRRAPTSAKTGARAVITADGRFEGWLGGACAEPSVLRVALQALRDGRPRLLCLGPGDEFPPAGEGREVQPVGCASEGALEVFIEPHLPRPQVVTVGGAPMAEALAQIARVVGFEVHRLEPPEDAADLPAEIQSGLERAGVGAASFVVVATMGRFDEPAVSAALAAGAPYVALVASRKRAQAVREHLGASGFSEEDLERLRAPAGLDLGSVRHEEIAVAVLAEIVQLRAAGLVRTGAGRGEVSQESEGAAVEEAAGEPAEAIDPVCGMTVATRPAVHTADHEGHTYHFCCAGCRERFIAAPESFLEATP
jgi:xanthine dehydrogenase accessory factor